VNLNSVLQHSPFYMLRLIEVVSHFVVLTHTRINLLISAILPR